MDRLHCWGSHTLHWARAGFESRRSRRYEACVALCGSQLLYGFVCVLTTQGHLLPALWHLLPALWYLSTSIGPLDMIIRQRGLLHSMFIHSMVFQYLTLPISISNCLFRFINSDQLIYLNLSALHIQTHFFVIE